LRARIGRRDLPGQGHHHRDRMFGGGDRIAERCVHHNHALPAGIGDIDIVDADPGAADDLEIGRGIENVGRHRGRGTDGEAVICADHFFQFLGRHARLHVDVAAALGKDARGVFVHLVGDENFGFGHGNGSGKLGYPVRPEFIEGAARAKPRASLRFSASLESELRQAQHERLKQGLEGPINRS
jgi:hypothetical protein